MKRLAILAACFAFATSVQSGEDGFTPLFNGKDLEGWEAKESKAELWSFKDGVLTAKAGGGWLSTRKKYADFVLKLEWRVPTNGNSGVFLRVPDLKEKEQPYVAGMEIQVLDDDGPIYKGKLQPWQFSGSLYGVVAPSKSVYKGAGQWNEFEITCRGDQISVAMNGTKIVEADAGKEEKLKSRAKVGYLGLQNHGSGVEYRNVRIKVLDK
jgi:3-keto-disaccharide hydrolase